MSQPLDNQVLRRALQDRGFEDITSPGRTTKSWQMRHPSMRHHVSLKLGRDTTRSMSTAPLVVHPDDARRLREQALVGIDVSVGPFQGGSTKYASSGAGKTPGYDVTVADDAALDALVASLIGKRPSSTRQGPGIASTAPKASVAADVDDETVSSWLEKAAELDIDNVAQPWRDSTNAERLDPYNGLLLTASIDRLFDRGLISFADDGQMLRKAGLTDDHLDALGLRAGARLRTPQLAHRRYLAAHGAHFGF